VVRVPPRHPPRGGSGRGGRSGLVGRRLSRDRPISRPLLAHLIWSALVAALVAALVSAELGTPCPPGGLLSLGDCATVRPFGIAVALLSGMLYLGGLSAVLAWVSGLRRRGVADPRAARDWYLLAAGIGLVVAPLLAFTLASAFR
jgi:hypothetical protein